MDLNAANSVTLNAAGAGTVELGPSNTGGPPYWVIDTVLLTTNRPGLGPVPRAMVYLDVVAPSNLQGITYDASFGTAAANSLAVGRGQKLIAVFSGGQLGDIASLTVVGKRGTTPNDI